MNIDYIKAEKIVNTIIEQFDYINELNVEFKIINDENIQRKKDLKSKVYARFNKKTKQPVFSVKFNINEHAVLEKESIEELKIRYGLFLESSGIEWNYYTQLIFVVLHELGHLDLFYFTCHKLKIDLVNILAYVNTTLDSLILLNSLCDAEEKKKYPFSLKYYLSSIELYADNFSFRHFPRIWNKLKEKGLKIVEI